MIFLKPEEFLPKVNAIFEILEKRVRRALPKVDIEHIGSSAIIGAVSKGDLDMLVRVSRVDFNQALSEIQAMGFTIKEGTLRTDSLCMLVTEEFDADVAIQLIEAGSEFEDFIRFRDLLNADSKLVKTYNELKMNSIHLSPDEYRAKKAIFIQTVLA